MKKMSEIIPERGEDNSRGDTQFTREGEQYFGATVEHPTPYRNEGDPWWENADPIEGDESKSINIPIDQPDSTPAEPVQSRGTRVMGGDTVKVLSEIARNPHINVTDSSVANTMTSGMNAISDDTGIQFR